MNAQEILTELQHACKKLYANQKYLIEEKSNELTIASHIASYLRESIQGWDIDTDYRREGIDRNPKRDLEGTLGLTTLLEEPKLSFVLLNSKEAAFAAFEASSEK